MSIYVLPVAAFTLQWQNAVFVTETVARRA